MEVEITKLQMTSKLLLKPLIFQVVKWSEGRFSQIVKILRLIFERLILVKIYHKHICALPSAC